MLRQALTASLKKPLLKSWLKKKKLWGLKVYWHYGEIEHRLKDTL